ncbi:MAG: hypothetical protein AMJ64_14520 [Betaproteobacteria bacterium SG8_39]|nr:MAG: hypothetical protein AMJ64_14520 [Betaproteobacteria bacterium SG8_39]
MTYAQGSDPKLPVGVIGLGVMGRRMLARLAEHPRLEAIAAWDPSAQAAAETRAQYPALVLCKDANAVIATSGLRCVYIASPPEVHLAHAHAGFDAGLAVFCEKPLTVDFAAGRAAIARIEREQRKAAVNFSLASSPGLAALCDAMTDGSIGSPQRAEIEVAFDTWPRSWQAAAGAWLAERAEGGFTREVISHFVFVLQRALGKARVDSSAPDYPADGRRAETALRSRLTAGGVPVEVEGRVGGDHPDHNRLTLYGSRGAIELHDWFGLRRRSGNGDWQALRSPQDNRQIGQRAQLDQLVALIEGRAHSLPGFAEALAVQETIEAMLRV